MSDTRRIHFRRTAIGATLLHRNSRYTIAVHQKQRRATDRSSPLHPGRSQGPASGRPPRARSARSAPAAPHSRARSTGPRPVIWWGRFGSPPRSRQARSACVCCSGIAPPPDSPPPTPICPLSLTLRLCLPFSTSSLPFFLSPLCSHFSLSTLPRSLSHSCVGMCRGGDEMVRPFDRVLAKVVKARLQASARQIKLKRQTEVQLRSK